MRMISATIQVDFDASGLNSYARERFENLLRALEARQVSLGMGRMSLHIERIEKIEESSGRVSALLSTTIISETDSLDDLVERIKECFHLEVYHGKHAEVAQVILEGADS